MNLNPTIDYDSDPHWVVITDVPILDEHELLIPADKNAGIQASKMVIDSAKLHQIASNNNARIARTGDCAMLVAGHTKDDAPEDQQPEILGEADNFRVGPLLNTGRQALWARFRISKEPGKLEKARRLPRRSVELWTDRWEIDPIALLGATAPERDLGVLRLSRVTMKMVGNDGKVRYEAYRETRKVYYGRGQTMWDMNGQAQPNGQTPAGMMGTPGGVTLTQQAPAASGPPVDPQLMAAIMAQLQQTDLFQQMQQFLQTQQAAPMPGMGGMPGMPPQMPGMPGQGGADPMAALMPILMQMMAGGGPGGPGGGGGPKQEERDESDRVRMSGASSPGFSFPGAGNTFLPTASGYGSRSQPISRKGGLMSYERNGQTAYTPEQVAAVRAYLESLGHQQQSVPGLPGAAAPQLPAIQEDPLVRLQRTNQRLQEENALLRVSMELLALQNEGVELDPQAEAPLLATMDDNARAMRYSHMRRYYRNRNERASSGAGLPQIPGAAPGVPAPVPLQYQRHGETATTPAAEAPATFEEREAIYAHMIEEMASGKTPDYGETLRLVRYGRRRNGTPTTGERTY